VYRPSLQLNTASNAREGDMVAGTYDGTGAHVEASDYSRGDFAPAPLAAAPSTGSFLVRLRRTRETIALDREAGVSSAGSPLPLLFGRGSAITGDDPKRRDGLTIRSVAIAGASPAAVVGLANATLGLPGAAAFAVSVDFWTTLTRDVATPPSGAGSVVSVPLQSWRFADAIGVGGCPSGAPAALTGPTSGVAPIFRCIGGAARVIAFGFVDVDATGNIVRRASRVVTNTAATAVRAPFGPAPSAADWTSVLAARASFTADPVLAPALVR